MMPGRISRLSSLLAVFGTCCIGGATSVLQAQAADSSAQHNTHVMGWGRAAFVLTEVLEYTRSSTERPVAYDVVAWVGGASQRLWFKADGGAATVGRATHGEYQVLYGRQLSPWWDVQVGARVDTRSASGSSAQRAGAVLALQGLAPGWFEVEPSLFVTSGGKAALDLTASYDLYLTQRLVMQPRVESTVAFADDVDHGVGRGLSSTSFGLRTRFEFRRELAPYAGIVWDRTYGTTADQSRAAGEAVGQRLFVIGLRLWR